MPVTAAACAATFESMPLHDADAKPADPGIAGAVDTTPARDPRRALWPLVMAGLGVLVRLSLPDTIDEALPMKKAFEMWGWSSGHLTLDPGTAAWPSLSFYVHLVLQHLQYGIGRLSGAFADRNDFFVAAWPGLDPIARWAHALDIAVAGGVIWAGAWLAQHLAGRLGLLLSGSLLALSPLLIDYSQLITPDILVALFVALAVIRIVAIQERGRMRDFAWAGVWIGLGVSSKYTPVLLLPAVFVAHGLRHDRQGRSSLASVAEARPWLAAGAALLVFVATSPYLVLAAPDLWRGVTVQFVHMTTPHFGQERQGALYYPGVLGYGLGWTGLAACLAGLARGSLTSRRAWLVLAACVVPFYLGLFALATQFPRYMLPLLMPLAVGASGVLQQPRWLRSRAATTALAALVIVVALAPVAVHAWRVRVEMGRPTTLQLADQFLRDTADAAEAHIAAEPFSASLPPAQKVERLDEAFLRRLSPRQRARLLAGPSYQVDFIPMTAVHPEQTALYYDLRHYSPYRFIVLSQSVRGRYLADPARFPAQARFYRDLEHYASLVWRTGTDQRARGAEIRIYQVAPESAAALVRERGPLDLHRMVATAGPLHMPTFTRFVEGVARAALDGHDWSMAERYYILLWDVGASAGFSEQDRASLARVIANVRSHSGTAARPDKPAK